MVFLVCLILFFGLLLVSFWNTPHEQGVLVLVASGLVTFFCINPFVITLVAWRIAVQEEDEALLLHPGASKTSDTQRPLSFFRLLQALFSVSLLMAASIVQFLVVNAAVDDHPTGYLSSLYSSSSLSRAIIWWGMLTDSISISLPEIYLSLFTTLDFASVQMYGCLLFLGSIFFSTTFSPVVSGVWEPLQVVRYLFPRFYLWCLVPLVQDSMEGCPAAEDLGLIALYMGLTSLVGWAGMFLTQQVMANLGSIIRSCCSSLALHKNNTATDDRSTETVTTSSALCSMDELSSFYFHNRNMTSIIEELLRHEQSLSSSLHIPRDHRGQVVETSAPSTQTEQPISSVVLENEDTTDDTTTPHHPSGPVVLENEDNTADEDNNADDKISNGHSLQPLSTDMKNDSASLISIPDASIGAGLTLVVGSSGSGKTTFLNHLYEHRKSKCVYIRQYHTMRPYIPVTKIPQFDPTELPFWDIYENEGTASMIPVGGTMAGQFTAGLSKGNESYSCLN